MSESKLTYVGLDKDDRGQNLELVETLSPVEGNFGYKVNLDHALMWGQDYIQEVQEDERPVFVDLKMNNGPRTMSNIVGWLADMGVAHTNVWAEADTNIRKTVERAREATEGTQTDLLGVTFYTRWDEDYAQRHRGMSLDNLIRHNAQTAVENGCDGVILPATHLGVVEDLDTTKLTPGIRLSGEETRSEQAHTATPYDAALAGSDILVVGSPVYGVPDPVKALKTFLGEVRRAETDLSLEG